MKDHGREDDSHHADCCETGEDDFAAVRGGVLGRVIHLQTQREREVQACGCAERDNKSETTRKERALQRTRTTHGQK